MIPIPKNAPTNMDLMNVHELALVCYLTKVIPNISKLSK